MTDRLLDQIEARLDELIRRCHELEDENAELRASRESWDEERTRLMEKNETARTRVEAMIQRLKSIDSEA